MAVFRVEKTKDFTIMSNHHLRNTELSLKAKGLLSLMLSLPEDWDYTTKGLAHICKDGVDSITTALKELERHGYLTRQRLRYDNGQLGDIEYLTEEKFVPLSTIDEYFQVPDYGETYPFSVRGQTIFLDSCSLAAALAELPEQSQEEIFLYYFQHLKQKEIGEQSGWTRSTIGRHIQLALKRLKEEMEVLSHE